MFANVEDEVVSASALDTMISLPAVTAPVVVSCASFVGRKAAYIQDVDAAAQLYDVSDVFRLNMQPHYQKGRLGWSAWPRRCSPFQPSVP